MSESPKIPGFAPDDPTDGRELGEWRSKYTDPGARRAIRTEAIYLAILLIAAPIGIVIFWLQYPKNWLFLSDQKYEVLLKYGLAWLGGVLGGTLFDIKWLYHTVARNIWNLDRRLWRIFTPHLSGGLAFAVVVLMSSGMIRIFDRQALDSLSMVVGVSFMVGYFSDSAVGKLREVADTLFGASHGTEMHIGRPVAEAGPTEKDGQPR